MCKICDVENKNFINYFAYKITDAFKNVFTIENWIKI